MARLRTRLYDPLSLLCMRDIVLFVMQVVKGLSDGVPSVVADSDRLRLLRREAAIHGFRLWHAHEKAISPEQLYLVARLQAQAAAINFLSFPQYGGDGVITTARLVRTMGRHVHVSCQTV